MQDKLPLILKRNKTMLGYLHKFEDGLPKCYQWFNDAKQLMSRYSIQVSVKQVEEFLDQHRVRSLYSFSMLFLNQFDCLLEFLCGDWVLSIIN